MVLLIILLIILFVSIFVFTRFSGSKKSGKKTQDKVDSTSSKNNLSSIQKNSLDGFSNKIRKILNNIYD